MIKKIGAFLVILLVFITGCSSQDGNITSTSIDDKDYDTKNFKYITCSRNTETSDDSTTVEINLEVYYNDDQYIEILKSNEKVTSTNQETLETYQKAYEKAYSVYDGLKYYDNVVTKDDNMVTSVTYINYGKIDMDKLMSIEGTEDNVAVTDGKIKLDDWKSFAKKYGTQCSSES